MKDLVKKIVQSLVDDPGNVEITEVTSHQTTIIEVRVAKQDIGKIIGKQGHTAHAIRTILNAVSAKLKKRVVLEILD